ncbi:MAG: radical SAM protein [Candidatus Nitricoxidivorans perseverans]|uniref:Radical SAM protein n=1 Tax=Candidatus Nitricoxidivorans perseverans TaxID=2975601 RepID=A0AA49FJG5_9PROT|nr:MAG: radical SAM protein [Candidatus Nitricoxidivorans perseverans]
MSFFEGGLSRLAASAFTKASPAYVQFYVTARCNLACEQCNIIYANADQEEVSTEGCRRIAENLARIGTSVVLLTGGEPFIRKDLPRICKAFLDNGIHPRIQTNGFASREQLEAVADVGVRDISVSLDALSPSVQDRINGGFDRSWERTIETIATINEIFPENSFAALGCVLSPSNIGQISDVVRFATEIGWWLSLVPVHVTNPARPRNFRTFDSSLSFKPEELPRVRAVLDSVKAMRDHGFAVYDSDEYLDDIYRFVAGEPVRWRHRNRNVCDSPFLYFAIQPNGDMAVCCDYRLGESHPVQSPDFVEKYYGDELHREVEAITSSCDGCMYGSFPEISISTRYFISMARRARLFLIDGASRRKLAHYPAGQLFQLAADLSSGSARVASK